MFFIKSTTLLALLAVFIGIALASPLDRRATNLELVLRETYRNTDHWHFALVIRPQGTTSAATTLEHVIDNKCMVYDDSRRTTVSSTQAAVTAPLIAANGETTNDQLSAAVQTIAQRVPGATQAQINNGNFNNCFNFATETARRLGTARYLSQADAARFADYYNQWGAAVAASTDAATQAHCARGTSGKGCIPLNTSTKPTKPVVKPSVKTSGKKVLRSESDVMADHDDE